MARPLPRLTPAEIERVIATAWDDRPPFNAVLMQHGLAPGQVVQLLKKELTPQCLPGLDGAHPGCAVASQRSGAPRAAQAGALIRRCLKQWVSGRLPGPLILEKP